MNKKKIWKYLVRGSVAIAVFLFLYYGRARDFIKGSGPVSITVKRDAVGGEKAAERTFTPQDEEYEELVSLFSKYQYRKDLNFIQQSTLRLPFYYLVFDYEESNDTYNIDHNGILSTGDGQVHIGLNSMENVKELYRQLDEILMPLMENNEKHS